MNFLLGRRIFSRYVSLKEGIYQEEILDKSLFRVHLFLRLWPKNYCTCEQRSWWRNMAKTIRLKPRWICRISFDPSNLSRSPGFSMKPSSFGNCKLISNYKAVLQVNLAWLNSLRERSQQVPRFAPFHTPTTPSQSAKIFFAESLWWRRWFGAVFRALETASHLCACSSGSTKRIGDSPPFAEDWDHIHPIYCYIRRHIYWHQSKMYCTNLNNVTPPQD